MGLDIHGTRWTYKARQSLVGLCTVCKIINTVANVGCRNYTEYYIYIYIYIIIYIYTYFYISQLVKDQT